MMNEFERAEREAENDGYQNEWQRAMAVSRMESNHASHDRDAREKAAKLAQDGWYVVLVIDDVHCRITDAVIGSCASIAGAFGSREAAERQGAVYAESGQGVDIVPSVFEPRREAPAPLYVPADNSADDGIPF